MFYVTVITLAALSSLLTWAVFNILDRKEELETEDKAGKLNKTA